MLYCGALKPSRIAISHGRAAGSVAILRGLRDDARHPRAAAVSAASSNSYSRRRGIAMNSPSRSNARSTVAVAALAAAALVGPSAVTAQPAAPVTPDRIRAVTQAVDGASIQANMATSKDWPTIGADYAETRYSKLSEINADNVKDLGLVWTYNLESTRGVESTPLVVDGIMYVTASWSAVHALDVRTGKRLWSFDPKVPRSFGEKACCDVVNRGVALHKGKVYVASFDGRLIALDAVTGAKAWEKDTVIDHARAYTITGAPRVVNGKVIIGNGGAEYGVRGYVTAYDAATGAQAWRWFCVPG